MTCKQCIRFNECAKGYGETRFYGKEYAANNVEYLCQIFSANADDLLMTREIRYKACVSEVSSHIRARIDYFLSLGFSRDNITIFVSKNLRDLLEAYTQFFKYNEQANSPKFYITLFGCKCETYLDVNPSFYVTTEQKAEGWRV